MTVGCPFVKVWVTASKDSTLLGVVRKNTKAEAITPRNIIKNKLSFNQAFFVFGFRDIFVFALHLYFFANHAQGRTVVRPMLVLNVSDSAKRLAQASQHIVFIQNQ